MGSALRSILGHGNPVEDYLVGKQDFQEEGAGGGLEWKVGVSRCKQLFLEWINNKVYYIAQGTSINHNGKEYLKKESIYMYNSHVAVQQKLTNTVNQLYFN